ncbi:hypothetical protein GPJ56_005291 [Histomonas meleagridis]|uniref:uncharacterized protein n=1 Tax=Histomonas meleagridis TaxID=135588 RepID=UPI003559967D|nr:hypothetical protein GPJ56_005291 [Histomonas meleagridis]KAH0802140.1 hypothetical protein GO595_005221 [Histomonas meleagridis]
MQNSQFSTGREWFERLFGIREDPLHAYDSFECTEEKDTAILHSKANNKTFKAGNFQVRNVSSFNHLLSNPRNGGKLFLIKGNGSMSKHFELIDVLENQGLPENDGATYLAASNFNCLEFVGAGQSAQDGVTNYVYDQTQGPYCSLGSGPAIVYRNYFVKHPTGEIGQFTREVELLSKTPITVVHGYPKIYETKSLEKIDFDWTNPDNYPVGVHRNCQLTMSRNRDGFYFIDEKEDRIVHHIFAAAFNFAGTVVYNKFTQMVSKNMLAAEYRGAILGAWENSLMFPNRKGSNKLYLTLLGGGVFNNPHEIIYGAIKENIDLIIMSGLDVYVVCFSPRDFSEVNGVLGEYVEKTGGKIIETN